MPIALKKRLFSRNRSRENALSTFFSKTSSGITSALPLVVTVFFTPALITTSLFSKELFLMLANILLSFGYIINFFYRLYNHEVSKTEIVLSIVALGALCTLSYILFPPAALISFISVFSFINQMAVAINLFFVIKDVIVPPVKILIERIAHYLGFNITERYYNTPPLTLAHDRFVLDQLLIKVYGHTSFSPDYKPEKLNHFNQLLLKLGFYINKYDETVFGYIKNKEAISDLQTQVDNLTIQASPDSAYAFIRKKIGFKTTKVQLLKEAKETVKKAIKYPKKNNEAALNFFSHNDYFSNAKNSDALILKEGLNCLNNEIIRQEEKLKSLQECLPVTSL